MDEKLKVFAEIDGFICPAEFWPALGYDGPARYVAIYWEQCGDEAAWSDGRVAFAGAHWVAYQSLMFHNFSPGHPYHWLLGSSDAAAMFWLVVDRERVPGHTGGAWLVPAREAYDLMVSQWPAQDAADVAGDGLGVVVDYESVVELFAANLEQDVDEVVERHTALEQALSAYAPRWGHREEVPASTG